MSEFLKKNLLFITVFLTGACVLIVEVVAVRVLSPHFGNTMFTVSSVISVILAALSLGYYIGGKYADLYPRTERFFGIILISGILILGFHALSILLLPVLGMSLPLTFGPLVSSLILFFTPALLLGTLSPYAVKLQSVRTPEEGVGSVSGKIFFWSTLGSIIGSLAAGFVLIPNLGINNIFIGVGAALSCLGAIPLVLSGFGKKRLRISAGIIVMLLVFSVALDLETYGTVLYSDDGIYEKIIIYDGVFGGRPTRFFQQDRSSSGAMFLDSDNPTDFVYGYTEYYSLYKIFTPDVKNALVIGGGAYSIPKALHAELPYAEVHVSEIEPSLVELARRFFGLEESERLINHTEDGRRFLRDSQMFYDLIFSDVYYSLFSIPSHFTTKEFFVAAKEKMSDNGVFIGNLIGDLSRQEPSLIFSEIRTFQSVFPNSYFFAVDGPAKGGSQNIIMVGHNSDVPLDIKSASRLHNGDPFLAGLPDHMIDLQRYALHRYPILTDDFAPVEYLTAEVLKRTFTPHSLIDGNEIYALVDQELSYGPRFMGSDGHDRVKDFLIAEMRTIADETLTQSWNYDATDGRTYTLTNIIGRVHPENPRRIILGTHYDSKRFADKDIYTPNEPVPGANDSASGVAVLLAVAEVLERSQQLTDIGIDFVFFDGEEGDVNQGSDYRDWKPLGSTYFADNLARIYGNTKPTHALILDMVCDKDLMIYKEQSSLEYATAYVDAFWNVAKTIDSKDSNVFKDTPGLYINDDHTSLSRVGIPSMLLIDFEYPPFHTTEDTLDKCSAESLETVARAVLEYLRGI